MWGLSLQIKSLLEKYLEMMKLDDFSGHVPSQDFQTTQSSITYYIPNLNNRIKALIPISRLPIYFKRSQADKLNTKCSLGQLHYILLLS